MLNKYKILRTAEKFVLDRKFSQAVGEYRKLLEQDPQEPTLLNTVGDLLFRQSQTQEALDCFRQVAEIYLNGGFNFKAVAMYKKILQVVPDDLRAKEVLAELYEKQGLHFEAARELKSLAEAHEAGGRPEQALSILKKLTGVSPQDPENWARRARLLARRDKIDLAVGNYQEAVRLYRAQEDHQGAFEIAVEALKCEPSHRDMLEEYVNAAEKTDQLGKAEEFLNNQVAHSAGPFPHLLFLAVIQEKRGEMDAAGRIYRSLQEQGFADPLISEGLIRTGQGPVSRQRPEPDIDLLVAERIFQTEPEDVPTEEIASVEPGGFSIELDESWGETPDQTDEIPGSGLFQPDKMDVSSKAFSVEPPLANDLFAPDEVELEDFEEEDIELDASQIASLEEALEEADFYLKLGFHDDGKQLLEKLLKQFPDDERVLRRARKITSVPSVPAKPAATAPEVPRKAPAPEKPAPPKPAAEVLDDEIENALGGLFAGADDDFEEDILRYQVQQSPAQDSKSPEVHYNLGLAYKEMGLSDDATQEFLQAYNMLKKEDNSPQKTLCCSMLANSYLQMGDNEKAARWAREGLAMPDKKDFETKALEYDLACALVNLGKLLEAEKLLKGILRRDANYRDVGSRLEQLQTRSDGQ